MSAKQKSTPLAERLHIAGQQVTNSGAKLGENLNAALNTLISPAFRASPGSVVDSRGQSTGTFMTLVRRTRSSDRNGYAVEVPADAVACAIDVSEKLDLDSLREAYNRIAYAKSLKKTPLPRSPGVTQTNRTLGVILASDSSVPLEVLADEIDRLNQETPHYQWPDMVVVLSKGVINYGVQFPGDGISGDFLPPAEDALLSYTPAIYIILVVRPTGSLSFNKMCSFLVAHISIFSPEVTLPHPHEVMDGTPTMAMAITGYQYNLKGGLVPVPREFYNDRYLAPLPMHIHDSRGEQLAAIKFLPWQEGGVILLKGKLPLDGLLLFLGKNALAGGGVARRNDVQISNVLPITQADFHKWLQTIQQRSNMHIKTDPTKFVIQKFADEGSSSPFMARLFIWILRLRDETLTDEVMRKAFDEAEEFVLTQLLNARTNAQEMVATMRAHLDKVSRGEVVRIKGPSIHVDENIDPQMCRQVEDFLNGAVRALKHGMQTLTKALGVEIGFLFQKPAAFEAGIAALEKNDSALAEYLKQARVWSQRLLDRRNAIEHEGWKLPKVKYVVTGGTVHAQEPEISGQPATEFVSFMLDRLVCFVEEVTTHCLQLQMPPGMALTEIPMSAREVEMPVRFRPTLRTGGMPVWRILYHREKFEEV